VTLLRRHVHDSAETGHTDVSAKIGGYVGLALLAFLPPLLTARGRVSADTKSYLYLEPGRLLARAPSMWDPNIGMGTVTHQNVGYLFPMGPYYWLADRIGVPDWIAQRVWLGSLVFVAALGVLTLARTLGRRGPGVVVAALAYAFSAYPLHYSARISVLLLPWAALGFLIAFAAMALRDGGWRAPALIAITVQVVGGVNATALVFAALGPAMWVLWAWLGTREVAARRALGATARIGVLSVLASTWWIAGLSVQSGYGIDILRYTETVKVVAFTSTPNEVLRSLGYWFFYGRDRLGAWVGASNDYMTNPALIATTYGVAALALLSATLVRWRHRGFFALLLLLGTILSVGAHPYESPTPVGALLKAFSTSSTAGLALRSAGRAVPLVALSLAMFLGAGADVAVRRMKARGRPRIAFAAPLMAGGLVVAAFPALWNGNYYTHSLLRDEGIPDYWRQAAEFVDAQPHDTRVLEIPGSDFASYRWGSTVDPITPGLIDRPYVARELIPWGSPASADLLNALDRRFQEGVADPRGLSDLLRRLGVGSVVVRNDLQWERYNLVRPRELARVLDGVDGLTPAASFGAIDMSAEYPRVGSAALVDERSLDAQPSQLPGAVVVYDVAAPSPIVRVETSPAIVLAGDGEGVVQASQAGLLAGDGVLRYAASMTDAQLRASLTREPDSILVVTDSNRRRARRWSTVRDNVGETETAGQRPLVEDLSDARLPVFPDADDDSYSVVEYLATGGPQVRRIRATSSGNPISHTPEDRPARAFDRDRRTAWKTGAVARAVGERLELELAEPITADRVVVTQVVVGPRNRYVTHARLRFDGGSGFDVDLGSASRIDGQMVEFGTRTFSTFSIEVLATNMGEGPLFGGQSAVGFAEIKLDDSLGQQVIAREVVRVPTDLTDAASAIGGDRPLVYLFERARGAPVPPRYDEELSLDRKFEVPADADFALEGDARANANAYEQAMVNEAQGMEILDGFAAPTASAVMPGCLRCGAAFAFDGEPADAWRSPIGEAEGSWIEVRSTEPEVYDTLRLTVVADGRHSLPARVRIDVDGQSIELDVPEVREATAEMATADVELSFAALRGRRFRVTFVEIVPRVGTSYYDANARTLPIGIADTSIVAANLDTANLDTANLDLGCRDDLVRLDGEPLRVRIREASRDPDPTRALVVSTCDGEPLPLQAGHHLLTTARGVDTAIDIDRLVLRSTGRPVGAAPRGGGASTVVDDDRTTVRVRVEVDATGSSWLVLGQSYNAGWRARVVDGASLGGATLVDGYANGWRIDAETVGRAGTVEIVLEWTPQRRVWWSIALSGFVMLGCTAVVIVTGRRRRAAKTPATDDPRPVSARDDGSSPARVRFSTRVSAAFVVLVAGAAIIAPWIGLLAAAITFAAFSSRGARWLLVASPALCVGVAGLYIAILQQRYHHPALFEWPTLFPRARTLGWIAAFVPSVVWLVDRLRDPKPEIADTTS